MAQDHGQPALQGNEAGDVLLRERINGHRWREFAAVPWRASCSRPSTGQRDLRAVNSTYPRQHAWILHAGDTWRLNGKLTLDYGLRGTTTRQASEKDDRLSFFDPTGANPGAAGLPGRLAFAGDAYGAASYGDQYPEKDWYGGFAPRLGAVTRSMTRRCFAPGGGSSTPRRSIRLGRRMSQDGFSNNPSVNTSLGGIKPAMYLD